MSDKKNYRRRKPLSVDELERRKKLQEERIFRKKREKKLFWCKAAVIVVAVVLWLMGMFLIDSYGGGYAMLVYVAIVGIIVVLMTDRCGLRSTLFKYYPDRFLFAENLKKKDTGRCFFMELARTVCYFSMCLIVLWQSLSAIGAVLCIVSMIIGYFYIITDRNDKYTFDKFSKYSDTAMFLILAGIFGLASTDEMKSFPWAGVILGAVIITVLYLIFGESKKKVEHTISVAVFSTLDVYAGITFVRVYL